MLSPWQVRAQNLPKYRPYCTKWIRGNYFLISDFLIRRVTNFNCRRMRVTVHILIKLQFFFSVIWHSCFSDHDFDFAKRLKESEKEKKKDLLETPTYSYDSFEKCQLITIIFLRFVIGRGTLKYFLEDINSKIGAAKNFKEHLFL